MLKSLTLLITLLLGGICMAETNQDTTGQAAPRDIFQRMVGQWSGVTTVWFEPEKPVDESPCENSFKMVLNGKSLQWDYTGAMQGKPLAGSAFFAYNKQKQQYEMSWMDTFHTGSAIMFFTGKAIDSGLSVLGSYEDPSGGPDWGWRIDIRVSGNDNLVITMFNIFPDGNEQKGVETVLTR